MLHRSTYISVIKAASRDSLADPSSLDFFVEYAKALSEA